MSEKTMKPVNDASLRLLIESIDSYLDQTKIAKSNIRKENEKIIFAISLKSERSSKNWEKVQSNLACTLRSILNNTHDNYQIIIAGHEKPRISEMEHKSVKWLSVNFPAPLNPKGFTHDKMKKRKVIGNYLRKKGFSGYIMPFDADDWLHYRFVEYMNSHTFCDANILKKGLMCNHTTNEVWELQNFFIHCGSCSIFYFPNKDLPQTMMKDGSLFTKLTLNRHPKVLNYVKQYRVKYKLIEHPLVLRSFGNGENNMLLKRTLKKNISSKDYGAQGHNLQNWLYEKFKIH